MSVRASTGAGISQKSIYFRQIVWVTRVVVTRIRKMMLDELQHRKYAQSTVTSYVFRGKFLEGLEEAFALGQLAFCGSVQQLADPKQFQRLLDQLSRKKWVVLPRRHSANRNTSCSTWLATRIAWPSAIRSRQLRWQPNHIPLKGLCTPQQEAEDDRFRR
jgi:hypothetical protein